MSNREPGWFPDPAGTNQQRYWDGARWTDYYLPLATASSSTKQTASETSAYSYLQDLKPTATASTSAPAAYYAPSAEDPVPYAHAQPSSGVYPVLDGPPAADTGATATPTFQAGSYHTPQYSSQNPHPGYGNGETTIGDDPQRPYETTNPGIKKTAKIAGIAVVVVLVMALAWGIIMTTRDEPDIPGGQGGGATTQAPVVSMTEQVTPGQEAYVEFPSDEVAVANAEISEAGFYQIEVIDDSYFADLHAKIASSDGEIVEADDRGTTRYGEFMNPEDPLALVWWEPGNYAIEVSDLLNEDGSAVVRVTGPVEQLELDSPTLVTVGSNSVEPFWVEITEAGSYQLQASDMNGQISYIGEYDRFGHINPGSMDPQDHRTTSSVVEFEPGEYGVAVWSETGDLTEVEVSISRVP